MGQLIDGRYEVIQSLSEGGFGITFLAEDLRRPGQPRCVVKQLKPQREFSAETWQAALRLFEKEAETLERLGRHDQIPLLLAHLEENGNFYIVQDLIEGRTFRDELLAVKRLSEKEVITLLRQGLTVLSYVHEQGVIHRDIKPENMIRRCRDGVLCLIDFGIVKEFSAQNLSRMASSQAGLVSTTISIGTPGYLSQEQTNGRPCPASDVYALGKVAIEALTGTFPTDLDTDPNTAELIWQTGLQISPALAQVLTTMVRHHHSRRYANGKEALQALEAALASPVPTVVVSPKAPEPQPPRPQPVAQDDLRSEKGIDYTRLRDLLKAGKWREADTETYEVMIRAMGKKSGQGFTTDELLNFPCTDLRTIDGLWVKYSQGKFGFSVQKQIYVECGNPLDGKYHYETWKLFADRVGWRKDGSYLNYRDLKANPSFSPAGEFPFVGLGGWWGRGVSVRIEHLSLAQRLVNCSREADVPPPPDTPRRASPSRRRFLTVAATAASGVLLTVATHPLLREPESPALDPVDDLSSERGVDYTRLRDLLKAGQWRKADRETYAVMLRAVGKESGDYMTEDEYRTFPCTDLRTIDQMWVTYSQGQFGFSVQKQIYVETGNPLDGEYHEDTYLKFAERVGWRKDDSWVYYRDLKANPSFSPAGEFPIVGCWVGLGCCIGVGV